MRTFMVPVTLLACLSAGGCTPEEGPISEAEEPLLSPSFSVFANIVDEGQYPESLLVRGNTVFVGTTQFPNDFFDPSLPSDGRASKLLGFDHLTGQRTSERALAGESTARFRGIAGIAKDAQGRIYAADAQGRIVRYSGASQSVYATVPDLSDDRFGRPAIADGPTFDAQGNLYIADPYQGALFRVARGGGTAHLWFRDPALDSALAGPNTIRISADGRWLYFTETFVPNDTFTEVRTQLYRLPLANVVSASDLRRVAEWTSPLDFSVPSYVCSEGFQLDVLGNIYVVANVGGPDFVRVLRPNGVELGRIQSPLFADPSDIAFDNARHALFVVNHLADPTLRQVLVAPWPIQGVEQPSPYIP